MAKRKTLLRVTVDIETDQTLSSGNFNDLRQWFQKIGLNPLSIGQSRIWRCSKCGKEEDVGFGEERRWIKVR